VPATIEFAGMTLYAVLRRQQELLACIIGTCPTCKPASGNRNDPATVDHDKAPLRTDDWGLPPLNTVG
jgi:hypothetical protein